MTLSNVAHLPTPQETEEAKITSRALSKYVNNERLYIKIAGNNSGTDDLIVPGYAINLLLDILTEMSKGNAIAVMPILTELSTQETAKLLNVSRPHLVELLEQGKIPFRKAGSHRRVLAKDVFEYKQRIDEARLKILDELAAQARHDFDWDNLATNRDLWELELIRWVVGVGLLQITIITGLLLKLAGKL